jgi:hypothetical protein
MRDCVERSSIFTQALSLIESEKRNGCRRAVNQRPADNRSFLVIHKVDQADDFRDMNYPIGSLAHLGLARANALQGDNARARAPHQDFLDFFWKGVHKKSADRSWFYIPLHRVAGNLFRDVQLSLLFFLQFTRARQTARYPG